MYEAGPARPTGGCAAVAILVGRNAPLVPRDPRPETRDPNPRSQNPNPMVPRNSEHIRQSRPDYVVGLLYFWAKVHLLSSSPLSGVAILVGCNAPLVPRDPEPDT